MDAAWIRCWAIAAAILVAGAVSADLAAGAPLEQPVTSCDEAGFFVAAPLRLLECRYGVSVMRGTESGHPLPVTFAGAEGGDPSGATSFYLVRVDAGRHVTISDVELVDFTGWFLLREGGSDLTYQEDVATFEVATGNGRFVDDQESSSCYIFLRQWGYAAMGGYRHQLGGVLCGAKGLPDRQKLEEFLATTRYETE
jgi:hypothetical protein